MGSVSSVLELGVGRFATEDSTGVLGGEDVDDTGGGTDDVLVTAPAVADTADEEVVVAADEGTVAAELAEGAVCCPHPAATATAVMHTARAIRC